MRPALQRSRKPARSRAGFLLAASIVAMPALAQVVATSEYLARMDVDHDGRISLLEYQDWLSYAFDAMDLDHDGVLTPAEQPGGRGKPLTRDKRLSP